LASKQLDEQLVEIDLTDETDSAYGMSVGYGLDVDEYGESLGDFVDDMRAAKARRRRRKVSVKEARRILTRAEANKLIDVNQIVDDAVKQTEESAVVFIDELDKLIGPKVEVGRDVSGEGVQRDLLPLLEGTSVMTRFGPVKTDHILYISAGAFYANKPSDLIAELQGRLPIRVELSRLSQEDLQRILTEPKNALTKQYAALMATEGVELEFTVEGIKEIARLAALMNERAENIGARRLNTITEKVLEEISFSAPERRGQKVVVDPVYVRQHVLKLIRDEDLSRYIL
jgi:ATP-dependent HslUV protease ATP-binding subunit HslU